MLILDRYALDLANERNAPQYRLEEACSALDAKRTVELHGRLCATLRQIRSAKLHQHGFVFTNLRGEPIRPGAFGELW